MAIKRVLIANRGEIAVRIIKACKTLGLETVQVVSDADRDSMPARMADKCFCIGPAASAKSYLKVDNIVMAALMLEANAIHPGYGFLSESAALSQSCLDNGINFVGPTPQNIERMGNKIEAQALASEAGVPTLIGSDKIKSPEDALRLVREIGMPIILKAAAGGGGRGMKIVRDIGKVEETFVSASAEAQASFGDGSVYVERYVGNARHVEVQIMADSHGNVVHLGERDCSSQRRHQKMVEEAPAPNLSDKVRDGLREAAIKLAQRIDYVGAGTVEFLVDVDRDVYFFLEMNTRIQVEHPVTEMITGIDLVAEQLRIADGAQLSFMQDDISFRGHAIECRVNAESPDADFRPTPGLIKRWVEPAGVKLRVDTHCYPGYRVPIFYDSMLAKVITHGDNRSEALSRMHQALSAMEVGGVETTIPFLERILSSRDFVEARMNTNLVQTIIDTKERSRPFSAA